MNKENIKQFFSEIENNNELKTIYLQLIEEYLLETEKTLNNKLVELGKNAGFDFNAEDLAVMVKEFAGQNKERGELSYGDLDNVSGGVSPYPTVQILQAAMTHRDAIRRSFESQRAALLEAIEAQRKLIVSI